MLRRCLIEATRVGWQSPLASHLQLVDMHQYAGTLDTMAGQGGRKSRPEQAEIGEKVRFEILGQLRAYGPSGIAPTLGRKLQTLLAILLARCDSVVAVEFLVDAMWGDRTPQNARNLVQVCVSRLRDKLWAAGIPRGVIATEPGGYRIMASACQVDMVEFYQLRDEGRNARSLDRLEEARDRYRSALRLWRGPPLLGIDGDVIREAAAVLMEHRIQALEECIDCEMGLGGAGDLVAELTDHVQQHPFHEGLHGALMLALYRAGRQADALAAYRHAHDILQNELGTEPGSELRLLQRAILNRSPDLSLSPSQITPSEAAGYAPVTPRELPVDVAGFTGRDDALDALDALMTDQVHNSSASVVVAAIVGTAGVGKTALALRWAHRVAAMFPDGQLYVDLRGYSAGLPLRPIEALTSLLRSMGAQPGRIPTDEAQAASMYRSQLAGRRVLVVLDNAGSVNQVRPLLGGTAGCFVLITSRDRLGGLVAHDGARRITLDVFQPDEALVLIRCLLGASRVDAEQAGADDLARACAYLPLALRVAAASLDNHPDRAITSFVTELTTGDRLAALHVDDDQDSAVRATFYLSYQRVPPVARRLFRLLGLVPCPDFTHKSAAALASIPAEEAKQCLAKLASTCLVNESSPGRYGLHDLLRLYAHERTQLEDSGTERQGAVYALLRWYAQNAAMAGDLLHPGLRLLPIESDVGEPRQAFGGAADALAWLNTERANLVVAVRRAADQGLREFAWRISDSMRGYFWQQRHITEWLTVAEVALLAAEQDADLPAQSAMRGSLGAARQAVGRYSEASEYHSVAADLASRAGWEDGECSALANLGATHIRLGRFEHASECLTRALELCSRTGHHARRAVILGNLGFLCRESGRLRSAADYCAQQLAMFQDLLPTARYNTARALANLATVERELGLLKRAYEGFAAALAMHREIGSRIGEFHALEGLALVYLDLGAVMEAKEMAEAAYLVAEQSGDRRIEGEAKNTLGRVSVRSGHPELAIPYHKWVLEAAEVDDPDLVIRAFLGLAAAAHRLGQHENAEAQALLAQAIARDRGYKVLEGLVQSMLALICIDQGRYDTARNYAFLALRNHRETGHRLGEARALSALGSARQRAGDPAAEQDLEAARSLFAEIGAAIPTEPTDWVFA